MRTAKGFTLLEIVVGVAILGIGVTVAMQVFSEGLGNVRRIDMAHRAMSHAENVMNEILADRSLIYPTELGGDLDENFYYSARLDYWTPPDDGTLDLNLTEQPVDLLSVVVNVHFKGDERGKLYRAVCLKAVSRQNTEPGTGTNPGDVIRQLFGGRRQ